MAREIKFRVIFKGKIVGYERLNDDGWQWMYLELNPDNGERWVKGVISQTDRCARVQFTGLKDRNDKEIFEGDVFGNEALRCVVVREEDGAYKLHFVDKRIKPISILDHKIKKSKVIGNIYESPELIQQHPFNT